MKLLQTYKDQVVDEETGNYTYVETLNHASDLAREGHLEEAILHILDFLQSNTQMADLP